MNPTFRNSAIQRCGDKRASLFSKARRVYHKPHVVRLGECDDFLFGEVLVFDEGYDTLCIHASFEQLRVNIRQHLSAVGTTRRPKYDHRGRIIETGLFGLSYDPALDT